MTYPALKCGCGWAMLYGDRVTLFTDQMRYECPGCGRINMLPEDVVMMATKSRWRALADQFGAPVVGGAE